MKTDKKNTWGKYILLIVDEEEEETTSCPKKISERKLSQEAIESDLVDHITDLDMEDGEIIDHNSLQITSGDAKNLLKDSQTARKLIEHLNLSLICFQGQPWGPNFSEALKNLTDGLKRSDFHRSVKVSDLLKACENHLRSKDIDSKQNGPDSRNFANLALIGLDVVTAVAIRMMHLRLSQLGAKTKELAHWMEMRIHAELKKIKLNAKAEIQQQNSNSNKLKIPPHIKVHQNVVSVKPNFTTMILPIGEKFS